MTRRVTTKAEVLSVVQRLRKRTGMELYYDFLAGQGYRLLAYQRRYLSPRLPAKLFVIWCDAFQTGWDECDVLKLLAKTP